MKPMPLHYRCNVIKIPIFFDFYPFWKVGRFTNTTIRQCCRGLGAVELERGRPLPGETIYHVPDNLRGDGVTLHDARL